mgnify:CR=1 FL=1
MEENTIKISHILFMILMIGIIIVVGTYAWLSYRSNDTAMVLTIGEINNVQVTLSPYQIKASLLPQVTYTSENYTSVTAVNNSSSSRKIKLYYKINNIDTELISSNFKYTIERSTNGTTYTEYESGNFSSASNGSELTILEESIPGNNTTYNYKVYLWIDGTNSGQSYMQGKSFSGELRAEILSYTITFNSNGGTMNSSTSTITYTQDYGSTITMNNPIKPGYEFLGWVSDQKANVTTAGYWTYTDSVDPLTGNELEYVNSADYTFNGYAGGTAFIANPTTISGAYAPSSNATATTSCRLEYTNNWKQFAKN